MSKSNQYIKLRQSHGSDIYINSMLIVSMRPYDDKTYVTTMDKSEFIVLESIPEIMKFIDKANSFNISTYSYDTK
jgi:hypothetical protein